MKNNVGPLMRNRAFQKLFYDIYEASARELQKGRYEDVISVSMDEFCKSLDMPRLRE
jgi:hypothetical protein